MEEEKLKPSSKIKTDESDELLSEQSIEGDKQQKKTKGSRKQQKAGQKSDKPPTFAKNPKLERSKLKPKNIDELISILEQHCPNNYQTRIDNGKLRKNLANFGGKQGTQLLMQRPGEYYGLGITLLETSKGLISSQRMINALQHFKEDNFHMMMRQLFIEEEGQKNGINFIIWVLKTWLINLSFQLPPEFSEIDTTEIEQQNEHLIPWIKKEIHSLIDAKLKIFQVGSGKKNNPVIPESWLNYEFENAQDLHSQMDELPSRVGKPKVTYLANYNLSVVEPQTWKKNNELDQKLMEKVKLFAIMKGQEKDKQFRVSHQLFAINNVKQLDEMVHKINDDYQFIFIKGRLQDEYILICLKLKDFFEENPEFLKHETSISVQVSCMQKAVRRGRRAPNALYKGIQAIAKAPPYNLPDMQFIRVSSARQLLWRSFIITVEDSCLYVCDEISMLDFSILALVCQADHDLQLNQNMINMITKVLLEVQYNDQLNSHFNWKQSSYNEKTPSPPDLQINGKYNLFQDLKNGFVIALRFQPMMSGDNMMLNKSLQLMNSYKINEEKDLQKTRIKILKLDKDFEFYKINSDENVEKEVQLAKYDHHCQPNIILQLQSSISFFNDQGFTTKGCSSFIWNKSSQKNVRDPSSIIKIELKKDIVTLQSLKDIQQYYLSVKEKSKVEENKSDYEQEIFTKDKFEKYIDNKQIISYQKVDEPDAQVRRLSFLLIFGQSYRFVGAKNKYIEAIICGNDKQQVRIKIMSQKKEMVYLENKERFDAEIEFVKQFQSTNITLPFPPLGYKWIFSTKQVKIDLKLLLSDEDLMHNDIEFKVNDQIVPVFDGSQLLKPLKFQVPQQLSENWKQLVQQAFFLLQQEDEKNRIASNFYLNIFCRQLAKLRIKSKDFRIFDWQAYGKKLSNNSHVIWKHVLVKLFSNSDKEIIIGPVDRMGGKLQYSISYQYEGLIWRIYNLLACLYPSVISIAGELSFKVDRTDSEYKNFMHVLKSLAQNQKSQENTIVQSLKPEIKTQLWDHQLSTSERVFDGYVNKGLKGFGDASHVGAGKTLTALKIIQMLSKHNIQKEEKYYTGFLVLIPFNTLFETWRTEIKKHTKGFQLVEQNADGSLNPSIQNLQLNTIVLTSLGRIRNHPIQNSWQLIVIDECLSVQRREALQTEEAWRQVMCSQFGVIMMSATFFRSRFDQLFYMLKMLQTGIPNSKQYLDTLLSEHMMCYISENERKWHTNVSKLQLSDKQREKYEGLMNSMQSDNKTKYNELTDYLFKNYDYIQNLKNLMKDILKQRTNSKFLIYARSKQEAQQFSQSLSDVGLYPDKSKKHVVVSFHAGTFGLNDLVTQNTILTRPPEPDKLPQIKGRIDRPGQKDDELFLDYFIIENTIEEALIFRLELAQKFKNDYIMPLAQFYDLALKK